MSHLLSPRRVSGGVPCSFLISQPFYELAGATLPEHYMVTLVQIEYNENLLKDVMNIRSLQGSAMAKQLGAEAYLECSAFTSEKSIHSVFRTAAMACINKLQPLPKTSPTRRLSKRLLHLPSKSDLLSSTFKKEKAKSCSVM